MCASKGYVRGRYDGLQERLTRLARRHYRSLNGEVLAALEAWLEQSGESGTSLEASPSTHQSLDAASRS